MCNSPPTPTSGNINSWTISHLGTEFSGLSQGSEHNGVQGNRHSVYQIPITNLLAIKTKVRSWSLLSTSYNTQTSYFAHMQHMRYHGEINPIAPVTFARGLTSLKQDCKSPTVITVANTCSAVCRGPRIEFACVGGSWMGGSGGRMRGETSCPENNSSHRF